MSEDQTPVTSSKINTLRLVQIVYLLHDNKFIQQPKRESILEKGRDFIRISLRGSTTLCIALVAIAASKENRSAHDATTRLTPSPGPAILAPNESYIKHAATACPRVW